MGLKTPRLVYEGDGYIDDIVPASVRTATLKLILLIQKLLDLSQCHMYDILYDASDTVSMRVTS